MALVFDHVALDGFECLLSIECVVTDAVGVYIAVIFEHDFQSIYVELLVVHDQDAVYPLVEYFDVNMSSVDHVNN